MEKPAIITKETLIPISVAITLVGGVVWLTMIFSDVNYLKRDLADTKAIFNTQINDLRSNFAAQLNDMRTTLIDQMTEMKADIKSVAADVKTLIIDKK